MPSDLYDQDILVWSGQQADLLRRLARGERVNGIDWAHVIEEIEDLGLSELNATRSYLRLMLAHLLKIRAWPDSASVNHWRSEIAAFQADAAQRFAPSMRQRIDLAVLYAQALEQVEGLSHDGRDAGPLPAACPFTLDQLFGERRAELETILAGAGQ
jgi:hypothetical protein